MNDDLSLEQKMARATVALHELFRTAVEQQSDDFQGKMRRAFGADLDGFMHDRRHYAEVTFNREPDGTWLVLWVHGRDGDFPLLKAHVSNVGLSEDDVAAIRR